MQLRKLSPLCSRASALTAVLFLSPAVVGAQDKVLPEGYGEARAEMIAAMAAPDLDLLGRSSIQKGELHSVWRRGSPMFRWRSGSGVSGP
jgi:hypothetical protein